MDTLGPRPLAATTAGLVEGRFRADRSLVEFRGVPYAEPPVGRLRWRPPQAPQPWTYVRDAHRYSPVAWQRGDGTFAQEIVQGLGLGRLKTRLLASAVRWAPMKESEDCLTLNVRAPADADRLPVMVWYHGGDHTDGAGSAAPYRSDVLPAAGCVLVTVNYRLGIFGFYGHPGFASETPDGSIGNFGLLDQIAALGWVRDNISEFGGDPENVTVFGESAGGLAVLNLMCAPSARGLFQRAVAQSPSDSGLWLAQHEARLRFDSAETAALRFASELVGAGDGQLDRMRSMPADDVMSVYRSHPDLGRHFHPTIGGAELPASPFTVFARGGQAPVPLITGYNADEGSAFAASMHPVGRAYTGDDEDPASIRAAITESYGADAVETVLDSYPGLDRLERRAIEAHLRDRIFAINVDHVSRHHSAAGHPTYRYHYRGTLGTPRQTIGAFHAAELVPLFGVPMPLVPDPEGLSELSGAMIDHWVGFATNSVPGGDNTAAWPRFDAGAPRHMVFDRPTGDVERPDTVGECAASAAMDVMRRRFDRLVAEDVPASPS